MKVLTLILVCLVAVPSFANRSAREGRKEVIEGRTSALSAKLVEFNTFAESFFNKSYDFSKIAEIGKTPRRAAETKLESLRKALENNSSKIEADSNRKQSIELVLAEIVKSYELYSVLAGRKDAQSKELMELINHGFTFLEALVKDSIEATPLMSLDLLMRTYDTINNAKLGSAKEIAELHSKLVEMIGPLKRASRCRV